MKRRARVWEEAPAAARVDGDEAAVAPTSWPGASVLRAAAAHDAAVDGAAGLAAGVGGAEGSPVRGADDAGLHVGKGGDAIDEDLDDGSLGSLRGVWLSMRDEEPPSSGMDELLAAAGAGAARAAVRTSRWHRVATMWRRLVRR